MSNTLIDLTVRNLVVLGGLVLPKKSLLDDHVADGAAIDAAKLVHRRSLDYRQADGAAVASQTLPLVIVRGTTGTLIALEAAVLTAATGDATVSIDLQQSTGGGAFASVLNAPVVIDASTAVRTAVAGVLSTTALADGDLLQLVVTANAGTGTLPQGLIVTVTLDESPN